MAKRGKKGPAKKKAKPAKKKPAKAIQEAQQPAIETPPKGVGQLIIDIMGALQDKQSETARREVVEEMLAMEYKRGAIVRVVTAVYKCSAHTVDRDIKRAKEYFLEWAKKNKHEANLGASIQGVKTLINQAHKKGDLLTALNARKHLDTLTGVTKPAPDEEGLRGVLILPEKQAAEVWEKLHGKPQSLKKASGKK